MLSITTTLSSLIAQNSLSTSTSKLNQAIECMTTGAKLNHAKDNAANYSIATNYTTKINALQVAEDNVNMGINMVSTATESLSIMSSFGTKLRELAVQASNGTYSSSSLDAITAEATQLINEIYREKSNCVYNGILLWEDEVNFHNEAMNLKVNSQGFLQEVVVRDTSEMTTLSSVDETVALADGTYSISTAEELAKLATMTNNGLIGVNTEFVLANNIDLSAYSSGGGWTSIGNSTNKFCATFDGNGYTISNLYINNTSSKGLFYSIVSGSEIKNVRLADVNVCMSGSDGCISGSVGSGAIITNCSVDGGKYTRRNNGSTHGGITGGSSGTGVVSYCYVNLDMATGGHSNGLIVGAGSAEHCYSTGTLTSTEAGGICGRGTATNCASSATIIGTGAQAGGIVATYAGDISGCYFCGSVSGAGGIGGIAGWVSGRNKISNCYVAGTVAATNNTITAAIMVSSCSYTVVLENCYYDSSKTAGLPLYGSGTFVGDTTGTDTFAYSDWSFQVGIDSSSSSSLNYTMQMENLGLYNILANGIDSSDTIATIDNFLNIIENEQTKIGTIENRLMSVLDEISTKYENLASSLSTIHDADIAEVSSEYIKQQILQQACATLMATANQSPSLALQLL